VTRHYPELSTTDEDKIYTEHKQLLADECRLLSLSPDKAIADILHLDLGFMKDNKSQEISDMLSKNTSYQEIVEFVNFWLTSPSICNVEFKTALNKRNRERLQPCNVEALNSLLIRARDV
jgi:hypothetical protein